MFFRLWSWVRGGLCWLYKALHLDRLFSGSVFLQTWFWCALPVVLAPVLCKFSPSVLVLGLALIGYASLLLVLVRDKNHALAWAPTNRYIVLYAAVYLAGTLFSVNLKTSLLPGVLSVAFILFALVLYNAIITRRQLGTLLALVAHGGGRWWSFYGILQYLFGWGCQSAALGGQRHVLLHPLPGPRHHGQPQHDGPVSRWSSPSPGPSCSRPRTGCGGFITWPAAG